MARKGEKGSSMNFSAGSGYKLEHSATSSLTRAKKVKLKDKKVQTLTSERMCFNLGLLSTLLGQDHQILKIHF